MTWKKLAAGLAVFLPLAGAAAAQSLRALPIPAPQPIVDLVQSADAEEIAFWNSVKDSRNAAEVQSYIDRYPDGVFVDLAKLRLSVLSVSPAPPPVAPSPPPIVPVAPPLPFPAPPPLAPPPIVPVTPPPSFPPPATPPPAVVNVNMSDPAIIREIQQRLYELHYDIPAINGALGDRTREAIRSWQTNVKRPVTGFMTPDQLALLRTARPPTVWGAIAFTGSGASGTAWRHNTRREAEDAAIEGCRKRAGRRADCKLLSANGDVCGALAVTRNQAFAATRATLTEAREAALSNCGNARRGSCRIHAVFCANGAHQS